MEHKTENKIGNKQPNIVIILADDMGYSDIGCFGGEVQTPNLDWLAKEGVRFTQFYNTARCSPSRASLLTGLHPHQTGIGILVANNGPEGYAGTLNNRCVTIPEVLKENGYKTYMSGKWHVTGNGAAPDDKSWPTDRGFDEFFGTINGAGSFYDPRTLTRGTENIEHEAKEDKNFFYTDKISEQAAAYIENHVKESPDKPFFSYVTYTAPHWPLHAHDEDIAKYKGRFDKGWDKLREERLERLVKFGILQKKWALTLRDAREPAWEEAEHKEWLLRCMEVYAAQIDRMDQGIGRVIEALKRTHQLENTIIIFLSDNGACAEDIPDNASTDELINQYKIARSHTRGGAEMILGNHKNVMPGPENTYQSYGVAWANLSNAPFRFYKHWAHEGGTATPLILHWPKGVANANASGAIRHCPHYLPDIMATVLEATGASYPAEFRGNKIDPPEGASLLPALQAEITERPPMFWEHEGNGAVRMGKWKLVRDYPKAWELYDLDEDRTELHDLAEKMPERVAMMDKLWQEWAARCSVVPRAKILELMRAQGAKKRFWEKELGR